MAWVRLRSRASAGNRPTAISYDSRKLLSKQVSAAKPKAVDMLQAVGSAKHTSVPLFRPALTLGIFQPYF